MKTVTVNYYTIEELKEINLKGYYHAFNEYEKFQMEIGYNWWNEALASVEKFLSMFDCTLREFVLGSVYENHFAYNDNWIPIWNNEGEEEELEMLEIDEIFGEKLKRYIETEHGEILEKWDECPLTGYCLDYTLLLPIHEFLTGEKYQDYSLKQLIDHAMHMAINEVDDDYEYQCGYEAFEEDSISNDYYYDINGNLE